jgi:hypothetical protein
MLPAILTALANRLDIVLAVTPCLNHCCYTISHRLDYGDSICDGFYEPLGDFPEIVEKGNFPTLGQLRHVQSFEQDSREVRGVAAAAAAAA